MQNSNTWKLLEAEYTEFDHIKCANATDAQIAAAEEQVGLKFSESYKYFLKYHEASSIGELWVKTINCAEDSSAENWNVVDSTKWFKLDQRWPDIADWYIVANDSSGDPIGINPKGEVWISYHDSGFEQEKLADDFEEFARKLLTETLWD